MTSRRSSSGVGYDDGPVRVYRDSMTEKDLMQSILDEARMLNWLAFHVYDSRKSAEGFPDILALHPETGRRMVIETKTATGIVTVSQQIWLDGFALCGVPAMVIRPCDRDAVTEVLR